ncbi:MAG: methylated-DNA--[protein]-cysteine S-methyltransferase [Planctomycetia bacterium]|nr:methylated-DNA--[protein]-cysteine S-methyltransferase [Planctomycetia bacterium]
METELLGPILLEDRKEALFRVLWGGEVDAIEPSACVAISKGSFVLKTAVRQLAEYLAGRRKTFDVPLLPDGTPFQQQVWHALQEIPYGMTLSYGQVAKRIGNEKAVRAVGGACGRNAIPIFIPCHRVIGASGKLTGFACGLDVKERLLALENVR